MIVIRRCVPDPHERWKRWAVLQYEQLPTDPDPVLVGCRYFDTHDGAETYKAKLEEAMGNADRQEKDGA